MATTLLEELKRSVGQDLNTIVVALIISAISGFFRFLIARRPIVLYYKTEEVFVVLGNQQVHAQTVIIQNLGGRDAERVQVYHNWPQNGFEWEIKPLRNCRRSTLPGGQAMFEIEFIQPGETIFITYIYGTPPNRNALFDSVIVAGHRARAMTFPLAPRYGRAFMWALRVLAFVGAWALIYVLLKIIVALWHL